MIYANALRIGNWVSVNGKNITVESVCEDGINMDESGEATHYVQHIKEIPITEDWLKKFGFEKEKNPDWTWPRIEYQTGSEVKELAIGLDSFRVSITLTGIPNPSTFYIDNINYVHQLQNLYFALAGRDLLYRVEYKMTYEDPNANDGGPIEYDLQIPADEDGNYRIPEDGLRCKVCEEVTPKMVVQPAGTFCEVHLPKTQP